MLKKITYLILLLSIFNTNYAQKTDAFSIGEILQIESEILEETRTINIYLPPNYYAQDSIEYSVIYLLDGSANEDFLHIVGLVQFFDLQLKMKPTIVVGIANIDRKRDFTFPTTDPELKAAFPTTGGSEKFIQFIKNELQPTIDANYKTNAEKTLIGQSLGGLLATEILLKNASLFSTYIIVSPSLWWDNESLLKTAPNQIKNAANIEVVVSVGKEGRIMVSEAKKIYKIMKKSSKIKSHFRFFKKEDHATILHNAIYASFNLLYGNIGI